MILPSSIRNCNRDMLKGNFNVSFVYVFTNIFNGKMYIGFHVFNEGDNYWHSSTCEEFGLAFNKTEPTFDYEIIAVDYNPIGEKYLHENDLLKSYLKNKRVKNIIVDNTVIVEETRIPAFFAKYS